MMTELGERTNADCLVSWVYNGPPSSPTSSVKISMQSDAINQTYQFRVRMADQMHTAWNDLIVHVLHIDQPSIHIG